jgi:hypothetical protein
MGVVDKGTIHVELHLVLVAVTRQLFPAAAATIDMMFGLGKRLVVSSINARRRQT